MGENGAVYGMFCLHVWQNTPNSSVLWRAEKPHCKYHCFKHVNNGGVLFTFSIWHTKHATANTSVACLKRSGPWKEESLVNLWSRCGNTRMRMTSKTKLVATLSLGHFHHRLRQCLGDHYGFETHHPSTPSSNQKNPKNLNELEKSKLHLNREVLIFSIS